MGPISVAEAARAGISWDELQSRAWRRVGPGQYASSHAEDGPFLQLTAAALRLPQGAAFAGRTAAWLHGLDLPPCSPIEVAADEELGISARSGVLVRRVKLAPDEVVDRHGLPTTSARRTVCDMAWRLPLSDAVAAADMALHAGLVSLAEMRLHAVARSGHKGVSRLRQVLNLAEPAAESPMETRLRLTLVLGGLPRPELQTTLLGQRGEFIARADLYYPASRLVIEFDGGTHRSNLVEDNRRQNRLVDAGYRVLRFTSADVLSTPTAVVAQVRRALPGGSAAER